MRSFKSKADPLDCALDLMRRLPPQGVEDNLAGLLDIVPDLTEDLLSAVDQPLKVQKCKSTGKDYLLCDYNRDGDSYRYPLLSFYLDCWDFFLFSFSSQFSLVQPVLPPSSGWRCSLEEAPRAWGSGQRRIRHLQGNVGFYFYYFIIIFLSYFRSLNFNNFACLSNQVLWGRSVLCVHVGSWWWICLCCAHQEGYFLKKIFLFIYLFIIFSLDLEFNHSSAGLDR